PLQEGAGANMLHQDLTIRLSSFRGARIKRCEVRGQGSIWAEPGRSQVATRQQSGLNRDAALALFGEPAAHPGCWPVAVSRYSRVGGPKPSTIFGKSEHVGVRGLAVGYEIGLAGERLQGAEFG